MLNKIFSWISTWSSSALYLVEILPYSALKSLFFTNIPVLLLEIQIHSPKYLHFTEIHTHHLYNIENIMFFHSNRKSKAKFLATIEWGQLFASLMSTLWTELVCVECLSFGYWCCYQLLRISVTGIQEQCYEILTKSQHLVIKTQCEIL